MSETTTRTTTTGALRQRPSQGLRRRSALACAAAGVLVFGAGAQAAQAACVPDGVAGALAAIGGQRAAVCGVRGTNGNDVLRGTSAADTIVAGAGNDQLFGAAGNDRLSGNAGADRLDGGPGADVLSGNAGNDSYVFTGQFGQDVVSDGEASSSDRLVFSDLRSKQATARFVADRMIITTPHGQVTVNSARGARGTEVVQFADLTVQAVLDPRFRPSPLAPGGGQGSGGSNTDQNASSGKAVLSFLEKDGKTFAVVSDGQTMAVEQVDKTKPNGVNEAVRRAVDKYNESTGSGGRGDSGGGFGGDTDIDDDNIPDARDPDLGDPNCRRC